MSQRAENKQLLAEMEKAIGDYRQMLRQGLEKQRERQTMVAWHEIQLSLLERLSSLLLALVENYGCQVSPTLHRRNAREFNRLLVDMCDEGTQTIFEHLMQTTYNLLHAPEWLQMIYGVKKGQETEELIEELKRLPDPGPTKRDELELELEKHCVKMQAAIEGATGDDKMLMEFALNRVHDSSKLFLMLASLFRKPMDAGQHRECVDQVMVTAETVYKAGCWDKFSDLFAQVSGCLLDARWVQMIHGVAPGHPTSKKQFELAGAPLISRPEWN